MSAPLVVRRRDGWWWWHCRPCLRTSPDRLLTWAVAVETALQHLDGRHGRSVGFGPNDGGR